MNNKTKMPIATTVCLSDLAEYGDDSVVSRTLCENGAGTITLFAFDEGQGLSEHAAPFDAFVQVVDGEGEFTIDGKPNVVKNGESILMPANIPHSVRANKRFKMLLTMLRKN